MNSTTTRISVLVSAVAPIDGVAVTDAATHAVRIDFKASANQAQRDAAAAVLASFDWSADADAAWQLGQDRASALTVFISDTTVPAKVLRSVALVLLDQVNTLHTELQTLRNAVRAVAPTVPAVTYPQYTADDLKTAVQNKINSGAAD